MDLTKAFKPEELLAAGVKPVVEPEIKAKVEVVRRKQIHRKRKKVSVPENTEPKPDKFYDGRRGMTKDAETASRIGRAGMAGLIASGKQYKLTPEKARENVRIREERKRARRYAALGGSIYDNEGKVKNV